MIIDGFDELLSDDIGDIEKDSENSQTMLQTLFELVGNNSNAKIILTSRKTSLITNGVFQKLTEFAEKIKRYTILEPDLRKWLSPTMVIFANESGIAKIANPILLTMLKSLDEKDLKTKKIKLKDVVEKYITNLLNRERRRQDLELTEKEQRTLFVYFTKNFIDAYISSDTPEYINLYFQEILSDEFIEREHIKEFPPLREIIERYSSIEIKPSEEQFFGKLMRHVLLDTSKRENNQIGFINDFFFGWFINKVLEKYPSITLRENHIDILCTVNIFMSDLEKNDLLHRLEKNLSRQKSEFIIQIDNQLIKVLSRNYENIQLDAMEFENFDFSKCFSITSGVFYSCIFKNCVFGDNISKSQFYSCRFYDCEFKNGKNSFLDSIKNQFYICEGVPELEEMGAEHSDGKADVNFEEKILDLYWPKGKSRADTWKHSKVLFKTFEQQEYRKVDRAIKKLKREGYLSWTGLGFELNKDKILDVKKILGR